MCPPCSRPAAAGPTSEAIGSRKVDTQSHSTGLRSHGPPSNAPGRAGTGERATAHLSSKPFLHNMEPGSMRPDRIRQPRRNNGESEATYENLHLIPGGLARRRALRARNRFGRLSRATPLDAFRYARPLQFITLRAARRNLIALPCRHICVARRSRHSLHPWALPEQTSKLCSCFRKNPRSQARGSLAREVL